MLAAAACLVLLPGIIRLDPSAFSTQTWKAQVMQFQLNRVSMGLNAYMPDARGWGVNPILNSGNWPLFKSHAK